MERNLVLYPLYQTTRSLNFWIPVFFLYFSSVVTVGEVLLLEAIYYAGVVALEVPSGYFSDRLGRRPTLIISASSFAMGYLIFATTASFETFVVAQLLIAVGNAFNSGTDSSLLYDSLEAVKRPAEFGAVESRALAWAFAAGAVAAFAGGVIGSFSLRAPYVFAALAAIAGLMIAIRFREPPPGHQLARNVLGQLAEVGRKLRRPRLLWVFALMVAMTVFNHVPYELFQPYFAQLLAPWELDTATPAVAGVIVAVSMVLSALASRYVEPARRRFGDATTLLAAMAIQGTVIVAMAVALHPIVAILIALRSVPKAILRPVVGAVAHPELDSGVRATYLSVQSLSGRLAFSGALLLASWAVGDMSSLTRPAMVQLLISSSVALFVVAAILIVTSGALRLSDRTASGHGSS